MRFIQYLILLLAPTLCMADSVPFAFQPSGQVSLANAPLLGPTFPIQSLTHDYLQLGDVLPPTVGTVTFTMNFDGTTTVAAFWVDLPNGGTVIQGFGMPTGVYHPIDGTLTVDGQSYGFQFVDPVDEPSSIVFVATGVLAIWKRCWAGD